MLNVKLLVHHVTSWLKKVNNLIHVKTEQIRSFKEMHLNTGKKTSNFAHHICTVFRAIPSQATADEEEDFIQELRSPYQMALPLQKKTA